MRSLSWTSASWAAACGVLTAMSVARPKAYQTDAVEPETSSVSSNHGISLIWVRR